MDYNYQYIQNEPPKNKKNGKLGLVLVLVALLLIVSTSAVLIITQLNAESKPSNSTASTAEGEEASTEDYVDELLNMPEGKIIYSGETASKLKWSLDENNILRITGKGAIGDYEDKSTKDWLVHKDIIKGIIIDKGVTSIGDCAFRNLKAAEAVSFGSTVAFIGKNAFSYCEGLTQLRLPNGLAIIEASAFYGCDGIESVDIPNSVTHLGENAFAFCERLKSISIGDSANYVAANCFLSKGVLESISVSEQNESYCAVDGILFNKDKTAILCYPSGKKAEEYTVPQGVTEIGDYCFGLNDTLAAVTVPDGVTTIGKYAFGSGSGLKSISLPESVIVIDDSAFDSAKGLVTVEIGKGVCKIGNDAFYNCLSLENINVAEDNLIFSSSEGVLFNKEQTTLVYYPCNKQESKYVIPSSVTTIGTKAFAKCTGLTGIVMGKKLYSIEEGAFKACAGLAKVYYTEDESTWDKIQKGKDNDILTNAEIEFEYEE